MTGDSGISTPFEWSKSIETSHDQIDGEHQKFVIILENLRVAVHQSDAAVLRQQANQALAELRDYAQFHFVNEEQVMDSFEYQDRVAHKRAHAGFLNKVKGICFQDQSDLEDSKGLVKYLYDWLIGHISNVDMVMVSRMNGEEGAADPRQSDQTAKVIDEAYDEAMMLSSLSDALKNAMDPRDRSVLRAKMAASSERLMNLVALADMRVQSWGCPPSQRRRLGGVRNAVLGSACNLIEGNATKVVHYGENILSGRSGMPYGCGAVMGARISTIQLLTSMIGGPGRLTTDQRAQVVEAYRIANAVRDLESKHHSLPEFAGQAVQTPQPLGAFTLPDGFGDGFGDGAATQASVLAARAAQGG